MQPLSEPDRECFDEIRSVLDSHNMLDRFGVALLHKHFEIYDGETLLEVTESDDRQLNLTTVETDSLGPNESRPTMWRLGGDTGASMVVCRCHNTYGGHGGHA